MSETFICDGCGGEFDKGWSDEEAEAELEQTFAMNKIQCELVCDDCYKAMGFGL